MRWWPRPAPQPDSPPINDDVALHLRTHAARWQRELTPEAAR